MRKDYISKAKRTRFISFIMASSSSTINLDDVFKKAAIGVAFNKSTILHNIKHEQYATHELVKLLNMYNSHSMAEIPIIVIKFVTRLVATSFTNKFAVLKKYINPENIDISIAPDELNFIINNHKPNNTNNIVFIVAKNILTSLFGISASNLDQQLLNLIESTKNEESSSSDVVEDVPDTIKTIEAMISASDDDYTIPAIRVPSVVSGGFGSVHSTSNAPSDDEEDKMTKNSVKLIDKFKRLENYTKRTYTEAFYDDYVEGDALKRVKIHHDECEAKITEISSSENEAPIDEQNDDETHEQNVADDETYAQNVDDNETREQNMTDNYESEADGAELKTPKTNESTENNETDIVVCHVDDEYDEDEAEDDHDSDCSFKHDERKTYDEIDISDDDSVKNLSKPKIIDDVFVNKKITIHKNAPTFEQTLSVGNYIDDLIDTLACDKTETIVDDSDSDC